jgi:SAM-dependent methyltransferase
MEPVIKINLQEITAGSEPVIIELGCGTKKEKGRIGIDRLDIQGVDIVADIEKGLPFIPDNSIDEVYCSHILEHVDNFELLIREIARVLKKNGRAHIFVPHFSNPHFYSDYTHKRPFGLYTFYYFVEKQKQLRRKVPDFYTDIRIEIISLRLIFRSLYKIPFWPYKVTRPVKFLCEWVFNLNTAMQEYYEDNFCYRFPCKGIELSFKPLD